MEFEHSTEQLLSVFYTENWLAADGKLKILDSIQERALMVSDQVMSAMSSTETPPGILAVVSAEPLPIPAHPSLILVLDTIANPGNLGTILRTAAAAGVDAVFLTPGSVDILNPKVVRGSMGALRRVPVRQLSWDDISQFCVANQTLLATAEGSSSYTDIDWLMPTILIIGNEAHGPSRRAKALAGGAVSIPMSRNTESLNAAIAAAILLFEAARQRRLAIEGEGVNLHS